MPGCLEIFGLRLSILLAIWSTVLHQQLLIVKLLMRYGLVLLLIIPFLKNFGCPAYCHVNDGKLEPRSKKCIFLSYADGVKGYRLWCSDPKSPKFIISRDVVFDESAMLHPRKESVVSAGKEQGSSKEVKLQVETSQRVQDSTQDQPVTDVHDSSSDDDDSQEEQETSIAAGRQRRQIRPPQRYGYADLVAYALTVAEDTAVQEPSTY
jgi:hypothetical protein